MREIKFRAWDKENNQMLDVQELNFEDCFYGGEMQIKTTMYNDYFDNREMPLMQYTGLHDKNGKEIYEGDIIKIKHIGKTVIAWVAYDDEDAGFVTKCKNIILHNELLSDINMRDKEVIGNIYDNPDLLVKGE